MMAAAQNQPKTQQSEAMAGMAMPEMGMSTTGNVAAKPPNTVGFPYGFPTAGAYRVLVQMKHGQTIETGAFDACASFPIGNANGKS